MNNGFSWAMLALVAGAFIPVTAALSGSLGRAIGNPQFAALVVISGAFAMVLAYTVSTGAAAPPANLARTVTPLQMAAGFGIAFYLLAITVVAPRLGVGTAVMLVVAAQIASSAVIDNFGLFGAPHKPVGLWRLAGLAVMMAGVVIAQTAATARPQE